MRNFLLLTAMLCNYAFAHSQNVGIGTTTPAFKLDVKNGSINTDSVYRIGGNIILHNKGTRNLFAGFGSGSEIISGDDNAAFGYQALFANAGGYANAAFGAYALSANQNLRNTAIGFSALRANTLGESNTACGANALRINLVGIVNTAVGTDALFGNQNGDGNTAIGYGTLLLNNSSYNTAVGLDALRGTTASQYNTAVGMYAARQYNAGWNNTIIGAEADISFSGLFNGIALGNLAKVTDNSRVRIGNSANWSYEAFANWTNISDGRYKKNIQETVAGLDFILKLRPVNYQMDITGLSKKFGEDKERANDASMQKAISEKEQMWWTGL